MVRIYDNKARSRRNEDEVREGKEQGLACAFFKLLPVICSQAVVPD
jgi:hypothetical protein